MENKYLKDRINIPDREANSWDLISFSTVCKENLKAKISEKEIIESYIHSIECLFNAFELEKNVLNYNKKGINLIPDKNSRNMYNDTQEEISFERILSREALIALKEVEKKEKSCVAKEI